VVRKMQGYGLSLPDDKIEIVITYLSRNFSQSREVAGVDAFQQDGPIVFEQICDDRGVCCLGTAEVCFGRGRSVGR
jgi:hypothetical protein